MNPEEVVKTVPIEVLVKVGAISLAMIIALLTAFAKAIVNQMRKSLAESRDEMKRQAIEGQTEREYDNYLLLRGMQVMGDCQHELIYCVMNGEHNGGLDKASRELEEFRQLSNENLVKKAAKYNIKIEK